MQNQTGAAVNESEINALVDTRVALLLEAFAQAVVAEIEASVPDVPTLTEIIES